MSERLRTSLELLLLALLGSPLVTPLLRWQQVPCTHDGHLHYHRVVAMLHAWRDGLYFSRWLPDLAFGYGYPFFLYREPLPLYLTLWPHLLGLPLPAAINLFYVACILAAGCFTYLWVRDIFGPRAAVVSAVAYMATPYQLIDALVRGNQVESMALALFPLILWAGRRFMADGRPRWFLTTTLAVAALALSHNISLLLFTPALALYLLFTGRLAWREWKAIVWRAALVLVLGLGMTAFYTAPAVLEIDEVTLTLSTSNRNNDFRFNFSSLEEMLAPVTPEDPALINPPLRIRLGWAPSLLAIAGLMSLAWNRRREQRLHIVFMAVGALLYLFFALPISRPLWDALPLIEFVQFPWRFIGRAALPIAVLAGAPFANGSALGPFLRKYRGREREEEGTQTGDTRDQGARPSIGSAIVVAAAAALLLIEALPMLYPAICVEDPYPTIENVHAYERESGMVGVDPVGSYFPVTVRERPQSSPLLEDYAAGRAPQRFDRDALPPAAALLTATYEPLEARAEVQSSVDFRVRYLTFYFPGWTATVDGEPAPITPEDPSGLITFPVPAGQHQIQVRWRLTPLRAAIGAASLLAAVGVLAAAILLWRREKPIPAARVDEPQQVAPARRQGMRVLALLGLSLLGAKFLIVDQTPTPLRHNAQATVVQQTDVGAGGLRLEGYNLSRTRVPAGEHFDIDLAWRVEASPHLPLQSNVWLRDARGLVWTDRETFRPRIYEEPSPVQQWQPGQWAWDSREVHILPGTPPGRYEIVLTLFNRDDLQPLTLRRGGSAVGPTAVIGELDVLAPDEPPQFEPQSALAEEVNGLRLLGYSQDRDSTAPGEPLLVTLFWEKPQDSSTPQRAGDTVTLSLRDDGAAQAEWDIAPVGPDYPPAEWREGERLRGQHLLRLPAALESGDYRFWLQDIPLGRVQVNAPQRTFEEPAYDQGVDERFGEQVRLAGYSVTTEPAETLSVALVWQAVQEMQTSYRVFVHLIDNTGAIVAQSDAEPAQWSRPTTGWVPEEYVLDRHTLPLPAQPPDGLQLRVGLYDAETGQRLQLSGGADFILLQP